MRAGGRAEAALGTLDRLDALVRTRGGDPRIEIERSRAAQALARWDLARNAALEALAGAERIASPRLAGGARGQLALTLQFCGEKEAAVAAFEATIEQFEALGDAWRAADTRTDLAELLLQTAHTDRAMNLLEDSLVTFQRLGNGRSLAKAFILSGRVEQTRRRMDAALAHARPATEAYRRIGPSVRECGSGATSRRW